jgi:rhodanese-related sulfurtransferase
LRTAADLRTTAARARARGGNTQTEIRMSQATTIHDMTPAEVDAALKAGGVTLVDVREPAEYAAERVAGAVLLPLSRFTPEAVPAGKVIFQCGSGKRSVAAIERCRAAGLPHAAHLAGGLMAWKRAGMPTDKS